MSQKLTSKTPIWKTVDHPDGSKSLVIFYYKNIADLDASMGLANGLMDIIHKYKKSEYVSFQISNTHLGIFISTQAFTDSELNGNFRKELDEADHLLSREITEFMQGKL